MINNLFVVERALQDEINKFMRVAVSVTEEIGFRNSVSSHHGTMRGYSESIQSQSQEMHLNN